MSKYTKIKQKNQDKKIANLINNDLKTYFSDKEFLKRASKLESFQKDFNQIDQYNNNPKLPLPNIKNLRKWINKYKKAS